MIRDWICQHRHFAAVKCSVSSSVTEQNRLQQKAVADDDVSMHQASVL